RSRDEVGPRRHRPPVERANADQLLPVGIGQRRTKSERLADEILLHREHLFQAEVVDRRAAVDLGAGNMAFLDAKRSKRLKTIGYDRELLAGLEQPFPNGVGMIRSAVDLVGTLARERQARDKDWNAIELSFFHPHERERGIAHVEIEDLCEKSAT